MRSASLDYRLNLIEPILGTEIPAEKDPHSDDDDCVIIGESHGEPRPVVGAMNAVAATTAKQEPSCENELGIELLECFAIHSDLLRI